MIWTLSTRVLHKKKSVFLLKIYFNFETRKFFLWGNINKIITFKQQKKDALLLWLFFHYSKGSNTKRICDSAIFFKINNYGETKIQMHIFSNVTHDEENIVKIYLLDFALSITTKKRRNNFREGNFERRIFICMWQTV